MSDAPGSGLSEAASRLLEPWTDSGLGVGVPPFDAAEPAALGEAIAAALAERTRVLDQIEHSAERATFANTIEPLEASAQTVSRLGNLLGHMARTTSSEGIRSLEQEVAPQIEGLEDDAAGRARLFERIEQVLEHETLGAEQRRLTEVLLDKLRRRGAGLSDPEREQLRQIHARLAQLQARFVQNLMAEQEELGAVDRRRSVARRFGPRTASGNGDSC